MQVLSYNDGDVMDDIFPYREVHDLLMEDYKMDYIKARYIADDVKRIVCRAVNSNLEWEPDTWGGDDD